jgi:hypothetical protein
MVRAPLFFSSLFGARTHFSRQAPALHVVNAAQHAGDAPHAYRHVLVP